MGYLNIYTTSALARQAGIHANTVRFYEDIAFLTKPERKPNGYRVFTDVHVFQLKLIKLALHGEILKEGLRSEATKIIQTTAIGQYNDAIAQTVCYLAHLRRASENAEEAIRITAGLLAKGSVLSNNDVLRLTRSEAAETLGVTIDTLRNWERNGLIAIPKRENGYRAYGEKELKELRIIRTLRCAGYSLSAILRMMNAAFHGKLEDLRLVIDTPEETDDIVSACDRLLTSLTISIQDGLQMLQLLEEMKQQFDKPSI